MAKAEFKTKEDRRIKARNRYRARKGIPLDADRWAYKEGRALPPIGTTIRLRAEEKAKNANLRKERAALVKCGIRRYEGLCREAAKRSIPISLSFDQYCSVVNGASCAYCTGSLPKSGYGLDRIDSNAGYALGNVVPCCGFCNRFKNNLIDHEEALVLIDVLRSMRNEPLQWPFKKRE